MSSEGAAADEWRWAAMAATRLPLALNRVWSTMVLVPEAYTRGGASRGVCERHERADFFSFFLTVQK